MAGCNICGGTRFSLGPGGRTSSNGMLPRCEECGSLERHRSLRALAAAFPVPLLSWRRALHFSPDRSFDGTVFREYEESRFGGDNSIDIRSIDRPDGSYDLLILSLVLEFVREDRQAFEELIRIGSDCLVLQITFGSTMEASTSTHYEEPHGPYGRFHDYGRDFATWFELRRHGLSTLLARGVDPVTGHSDPFYFLCRSPSDGETLRAAVESAGAALETSLVHPGETPA